MESHDPEQITDKKLLEMVMTRLSGGNSSWIEGKVGVGKTHSIIELVRLLANFLGETDPIQYYYGNTLFEALRKNNAKTKQFNFIDDFAEPPAQWLEPALETYIEKIYAENKVFVITSNIPMEKYPSRRIQSRLQSMASSFILYGPDRRDNQKIFGYTD